ncbi:MAG TPA: branched-chain amino acid ABC transporter substrate-binding protein, partial [Acidimicrobiia bacterium]|nr:branched-chain amino acid ABC transporter substrate-binding protein [Acidimicrobiia bacterium]
VLAFAQILGTPQTQAVVPRMIEEGVVAAPATWWSGWAFSDFGGDHILESGAPYCLEAMNGMAFMSQALPEGFTWALIRFPGDYGGDYGAGALIAAAQLGLGEPLFDHLQIPLSAGGDVTEAVTLAATHTPTLIVIVSGPREMAQIVGGTFQAGHQAFQVLGASPTWNVALLGQEALLPLLVATYFATVPFAGWDTDSDGHAAMRAAADAAGQSPNGAYTAGWSWQYPMKALLEAAIASRDLTRASLLSLAATLADVNYDGMMPNRTYGDPNSTIERSTIVMKVDPASSDGLTPVSEVPFISPLAADFNLAGPCFTG